jgi:hypothetical protein
MDDAALSRNAPSAFSWKAALLAEIASARRALHDPDPDTAVHQARVSLKRVRALARLGGADSIARTARALKYALAGWRDLTALENAARDTAALSRPKAAAALEDIAARLSQARMTLGRPAIADLDEALARLRGDAEALGDLDQRSVRRRAHALVRDTRKAWKKARLGGDIEARHRWRRRVKDRFFAATALGEAWPARRRRRINEDLGNVLGRERDARLLLARLESEPAPHTGAAKNARRALKRAIRKHARRADRLGRKLHRGGA